MPNDFRNLKKREFLRPVYPGDPVDQDFIKMSDEEILKDYLRRKLEASQRDYVGFKNRYQPEYNEARSSDNNAFAEALTRSSAQIGTLGGKAADTSTVSQMADDMRRTAKDRTEDFYLNEERQRKRMETAIGATKESIEGRVYDPDSEESRIYRDQLKAAFPDVVKQLPTFDKLSAHQIEKYLPLMSQQLKSDKDNPERLALERDRLDAKIDLDNRKMDIQERIYLQRLKQQSENEAARKAERSEEKSEKAKEKATISEKQALDLAGYDDTIGFAEIIRKEKQKFDTGIISSAQNYIAQSIGRDDPEKSAFKANVEEQLANYIKNLSGAAVSDKERSLLRMNLPAMNDNDKTFEAKLENVLNRLKMAKKVRIIALENIGKDLSRFKDTIQTGDPVTQDPDLDEDTKNESSGITIMDDKKRKRLKELREKREKSRGDK